MLKIALGQMFGQVPVEVRHFLKKAIICVMIWLVSYYFIMQPVRIPDKWITNITADATIGLLTKIYSIGFTSQEIERITSEGHKINGVAINFKNSEVLYVADACNAFELYVLYVAFLFCLPTNFRKMMVFIVSGIAVIFILNIVRCFALAIMNINQSPWVNVAHHYIFTLIVYGCIFAGWMLYTKNNDPEKERQF